MRQVLVHLILRLGVAFAFLYPPVAAFYNPVAWIGFFPSFLQGIFPGDTLLHAFGVVEISIGLWILWGRYIFIPSVVATILLVGIVLFNIPQMDIVFRDISIAAMTLALSVLSYPKRFGEV